jgi:hypothetical protein
MATITWDQIRERVAAFHARHNAPMAQARRAALELRSLMVDLDHRQRAEILALLLDELQQIDQPLPIDDMAVAVESLA